MGSLCRFLLSSPLQWWVRSGLWVLVRIGVRGFRFCCGSALEVFGFWFCGFCFESLVLGLVLAWITGFRFGLNHWFWVLVWITDSGFIGGRWLQNFGFVYWCQCWCWCRCFVDGFVAFVDGLWSVVCGRWFWVRGFYWWLVVDDRLSLGFIQFYLFIFFSLSKVMFFIFFIFF